MIKHRTKRVARVCQGDILRHVPMLESVTERNGELVISKVHFPLVIVLTQDCDLEQDYRSRWSRDRPNNQDKHLFSVLVAPVYNAEHVFSGEHLSELKLSMQIINRTATPGKTLKRNDTPRYHYLEFSDRIQLVPSIIDFKHFFSVNGEFLKKHKALNFVCSLADLYREDVSQRFAAFLSRIGLPEVKTILPGSATANQPLPK